MQRLPEIQARFRDVIVHGETSGISDALIGGCHPEKRLAIHQRNYEVSLTGALLTKFPATQWLLGTRFLTEVARRFIRECPPRVPCIAEYGSDFPEFIGECASQLPYVRDFARFEWAVGKAAIAVDQPAVGSQRFFSDRLVARYICHHADKRSIFAHKVAYRRIDDDISYR